MSEEATAEATAEVEVKAEEASKETPQQKHNREQGERKGDKKKINHLTRAEIEQEMTRLAKKGHQFSRYYLHLAFRI